MTKYEASLKKLGLSHSASLSEAKKAFRIKAKHLHPDVNPSKTAQEEFLSLARAYEYVISYKTRKPRDLNNRREPTGAENKNKKYGTHKNWDSEVNRELREQARKAAEEKRAAYLKSDQYKKELIFSDFFNYVALALVILLAGAFVACPLLYGIKGLIPLPLIFVVGFPLWWAYVRKQFKYLSLVGFKSSYLKAKDTYEFWVVTLGLTNIIIFFKFTLSTELETMLIFGLLGLSIFLPKLITYQKNFSSEKQNYWALGMVPFFINLMFLLNYSVSFNTQKVSYKYKFTPYGEVNSSSISEGMIYLEDNAYDKYAHLRMFFDMDKESHSTVTYTLETGLLGIPVIKDYAFSGAAN